MITILSGIEEAAAAAVAVEAAGSAGESGLPLQSTMTFPATGKVGGNSDRNQDGDRDTLPRRPVSTMT